MATGSLIDKLFSGKENDECYKWEADSEGLNFFVIASTAKKIVQGDAGLKVTQQHIALEMLVEQEYAESIPNGFIVPTNIVVNFDRAKLDLFQLPSYWDGSIIADIQGMTGSIDFSIKLRVEANDGSYTSIYKVNGPVLELSKTQVYILTKEQQIIFGALDVHHLSEKTEYDNLCLVLALQDAKRLNAKISLAHFDTLNIKAPNSISIEAESDEEGNLILTPFMGQDASHERIQQVLGQLRSNNSTAIRVDSEIILFDEERLSAVREILESRIISKSDVRRFIESPSSFIDASLVDLDCGFSVRVHGATKFKHSYFGETDESGIDWFGAGASPGSILPISKLFSRIEDHEELARAKVILDDAVKSGSDEIVFDSQFFDISDKSAVAEVISRIEKKVNSGISSDEDEPDTESDQVESDVLVVDVELNDETLDLFSPSLEKSITQILYPEHRLNWSNYRRNPYPHQVIGVSWIMGLALADERFGGGLLADDMGLGKTFMVLAAVDQLYQLCKQSDMTRKPCLVVAPLSVIQNWKTEVEETFVVSPFKDIIILQSDADLSRYRCGGVETTQQTLVEDSIAEIRYSLKVGQHYFQDRLDMPQRLIVTTYETLRDYQFSLCRIDWGMAIFDEAQYIKNPNALKTRAAMGVKADFKLLVTGTPVENSLADFWCLMQIASFNYLGSYQNFREEFIIPILRSAGDEVDDIRGKIGRELRLKVGTLMLRRIKEDNLEGLPNKNIFVGIDGQEWEYMPALKSILEGRQRDIYEAVISTLDNSETNVVLSSLQRLRDISLHPQLPDRGRLDVPQKNKLLKRCMLESGKMQSLLTILNSIKKRDEKCIIFLVNKRLQAFLSITIGRLYGLGPLFIINGDAKAIAKKKSTPTRISMIKDFEARDGFNVILMSPVAAGVGLTIVAANNIIHLERHWNPAKEAQATDRVYRIGQKRDVNVFIPIIHHPNYESFDVNLHRLLSNKTLLKDSVITPEQVVPTPGGVDDTRIDSGRVITEDDLRKISWEQFESLCAELFMKELSATSCWLTQEGADYGADAVLVSNTVGVLIQCKHTRSSKYEGYKAIQEVHGAVIKYAKLLDKGICKKIFATNAKKLSMRTRKIAREYDVEMFSHTEITQLLNKHLITFETVLKRLGKKRLQID